MVEFVAAHTGTITVHSWWLYHNDPSTLCYAFSKSVYSFIYLKKFWFVHKYPIVLCRLRMSMDHLDVIMCIYITCLIQSGNTSGIMSSCTTNSNPNKYLKPTFFFGIVFVYFPLHPILIAGSCCCSVIRQMEQLWRILRMGAFKVVEFTQVCLTNSKTCMPVT
jgi:hypothetical protein